MRYPEFTDKSGQSKWEGKFSRSGFIHAALATKQSTWLGEYNQADLDFVNSELKRLGGFELLSWAGINRVDFSTARVDRRDHGLLYLSEILPTIIATPNTRLVGH